MEGEREHLPHGAKQKEFRLTFILSNAKNAAPMETKLVKIEGVWINPAQIVWVRSSESGCEVCLVGDKAPGHLSMTAEQFVEAVSGVQEETK